MNILEAYNKAWEVIAAKEEWVRCRAVNDIENMCVLVATLGSAVEIASFEYDFGFPGCSWRYMDDSCSMVLASVDSNIAIAQPLVPISRNGAWKNGCARHWAITMYYAPESPGIIRGDANYARAYILDLLMVDTTYISH